MKPVSSASLNASFIFRIDDTSVGIDSVTGNPQLLLGYQAHAFLTNEVDLKALVHAEDADVVAQLFARQATAQRQVANIRLRQANGKVRCVKCSYEKLATESGVTLDLLLEDAKSLPRTLEDAAAIASFRAMMGNTDDFVYFKDRNHVFTGASQTLVALCDPANHWTDLIGKSDYDVFPEQYADAYYRLEKQVFAGLRVAHEVQAFVAKDGRTGWVDNRKYPISNGEGQIIGLFGVARDITDLKRAQEALAESEHRFKTIFEQLPTISVQGYDKDRRVIYWNKASESVYGYTQAQALGRQLEDLIIPAPMRDTVINAVDAWAQGGIAIPPAELTLQAADGSPVEVFSSHVMLHGSRGEPEMCWRRFKFDQLCRLNFDQGPEPGF